MDTVKNEYLPYRIYQNILELLKYRKLELVNDIIKEQDFIKDIQFKEYILIEAKDAPDKDRRFIKKVSSNNRKKVVKTYIAILDIDSSYANNTQKFAKLLSKIPSFDDETRNFNLEFLIIGRRIDSVHIGKKVKAEKTHGTATAGFRYVTTHDYFNFTSILPLNKSIDPHRIVSKAEEKELLEKVYIAKKDLPKIYKNSAIMIWLGGEIGDIVEVLIRSEVTAIEVKYYVVRS